MPETPNFAQIAHHIVDVAYTDDGVSTAARDPQAVLQAGIAEQLRAIWNARGAADLAKIKTELTATKGATAGGPVIKNLERALRKLNR
jgi:hypothetical protein